MHRIAAENHLDLSLSSLIAHGQWTEALAPFSYRILLVALSTFVEAHCIHCGALRALKGQSFALV